MNNKFKVSLEEAKTCQICKEKFKSTRKRSYHVRKKHNLNFEEYIVKVYFDGKWPECKCGCETKLSFKGRKLGPWFSNYTKNHFPRDSHSKKTKKKIEKRTKKAIKEKFGVENVFQLDSIKEKSKKTKKRKYGNKNYNNKEKNIKSQLKNQYKKLETKEKLPNLKLLFSKEEYKGTDIQHKYPFKCEKCGTEFISHLDNGNVPDCPTCSPNKNQSKNEEWFYNQIKKCVNVPLKRNDKSTLSKNRELDIFVPKHNFALEYNSLYYHGFNFLGPNITYHLEKRKECLKKDINLIHIFSDDFKKHKDLIKNSIPQWFHKNQNNFRLKNKKIFCSKKEVGKIKKQQENIFVKLFGFEVPQNLLESLKSKFPGCNIIFDRGTVFVDDTLNPKKYEPFVWWANANQKFLSFSNVKDYKYFDKVSDCGYLIFN